MTHPARGDDMCPSSVPITASTPSEPKGRGSYGELSGRRLTRKRSWPTSSTWPSRSSSDRGSSSQASRRSRKRPSTDAPRSIADSMCKCMTPWVRQGRQQIDGLWAASGAEARTTAWNTLKQDTGSPTLTHLRALVDHHQWLLAQQPLGHVLSGPPTAKMEQFAAEARSLDAARMQALEPHKRYTLAAVLLQTQFARCSRTLARCSSSE